MDIARGEDRKRALAEAYDLETISRMRELFAHVSDQFPFGFQDEIAFRHVLNVCEQVVEEW